MSAAVASALLAWRHPAELLIPSCPFLAATGLYCPGCGSLRAGHHLLQLHWHEAWLHNPALVVILPLLALWLVAHFDTVLRGRRWTMSYRPAWGWGVLCVTLGYWILRNLPLPFFAAWRPPG